MIVIVSSHHHTLPVGSLAFACPKTSSHFQCEMNDKTTVYRSYKEVPTKIKQLEPISENLTWAACLVGIGIIQYNKLSGRIICMRWAIVEIRKRAKQTMIEIKAVK